MSPDKEAVFLDKLKSEMKNNKPQDKNSKENIMKIFTDKELNDINEDIQNIMKRSIIKVKDLDSSDLKISPDDFYTQMNRLTVISSNVIEDIHTLNVLKEKLESIISKMELKIMMFARCKSNVRFKNTKESDAFMRSQSAYSKYKELYEETKSNKIKYDNYFTVLKETKGLLRDMIKLETQKRFSDKWES